MKKSYCIYTDQWIADPHKSVEHIIPLSLGGCDEFTINVDTDVNKRLGSKIDGKFGNDYLINSLRRIKELVGHNNKKPSYVFKKVKIKDTNEPVQIVVIRK